MNIALNIFIALSLHVNSSTWAESQTPNSLLGVAPGRDAEEVRSILGEPASTQRQGDFSLWFYPLKSEPAQLIVALDSDHKVHETQMIAADELTKPIESLQVRGLRLGDEESRIYSVWGKPLSHMEHKDANYTEFVFKKGWTAETRNGRVRSIALSRVHRDQDGLQDHLDAAENAYRNGDYPAALRAYRKALKVKPSEYQALFGLGRSAYWLGDFKTAYRYLKRASKHLEEESLKETGKKMDIIGSHALNTPDLYTKLGITCVEIQRYPEAISHLEKARSLAVSYSGVYGTSETKKNLGDILFNLALANERLGKKQKALEYAREADQLQPNDSEIQQLIHRL